MVTFSGVLNCGNFSISITPYSMALLIAVYIEVVIPSTCEKSKSDVSNAIFSPPSVRVY